MNIYLLELISKWISIFIISISSNVDSDKVIIENQNKVKDLVAQTEIIPYETETIYNDNLAIGEEKEIQKGQNGVVYVINGTRQEVKPSISRKIEVGTKKVDVFAGKMTGYGADCVGCSGLGNLSCHTKNGVHSLLKQGEYYDDSEYGKVRILAAALEKFPCGTIVRVSHPNLGTFNAIVLDTGSAMNQAFLKGEILMDLAYVTQTNPSIKLSTTNNAKYEILRWGGNI